MNTQRRRWFDLAGLVVEPAAKLTSRKFLPLGFLVEFAALILVSNARPSLAPRLMGRLWPETVEV